MMDSRIAGSVNAITSS